MESFDSSINPNASNACNVQASLVADNINVVKSAGAIQAFLCPSDDTLSDLVENNRAFGTNFAAMVSIELIMNSQLQQQARVVQSKSREYGKILGSFLLV